MRTYLLGFCALAAAAASAHADEIVFKDGTTVRCEIYRETEDYVHYIDPAKDMCCGASKRIIQEVRHEDEPVVDVEAFLERKAEALATEQAEELRSALARRAAGAKEKKAPAAIEEKGEGKLRFRPLSVGVEVVGDPGSDTPELIVDPFPEEDLGREDEPEGDRKQRDRSRRKRRRGRARDEAPPEEEDKP